MLLIRMFQFSVHTNTHTHATNILLLYGTVVEYILKLCVCTDARTNTHIHSGIDLTHPEFEGRAKFGYDSVDNPPRQDDPNGHGTHVAGVCGVHAVR